MNIPGPTPLPFVGNFHSALMRGLTENHQELIRKYGKTVGVFDGFTPMIITADVNLIKNITIRDFSHFVNHRVWQFKIY